MTPDGLVPDNEYSVANLTRLFSGCCLLLDVAAPPARPDDGFWLVNQFPAPRVTVNQLLAIDVVTARVKTARQGDAAEANQQRKVAMTANEKECSERLAGERCDVVAFHSGGLIEPGVSAK